MGFAKWEFVEALRGRSAMVDGRCGRRQRCWPRSTHVDDPAPEGLRRTDVCASPQARHAGIPWLHRPEELAGGCNAAQHRTYPPHQTVRRHRHQLRRPSRPPQRRRYAIRRDLKLDPRQRAATQMNSLNSWFPNIPGALESEPDQSEEVQKYSVQKALPVNPALPLFFTFRGFNFPAHRNLRVSEGVENLLR
jgi:hypothetical protein